MVYLRLPIFGWISHWHLITGIILAFFIYSLDFLGSFEFMQIPVALILGFFLSLPAFSLIKRVLFRKIIAFDMGGVFVTGNYKFERVRPIPETVAFIKKLKSSYNTALLSNQPPDAYDNLRRKFNLDAMFDYQIIPMHAWAEKPDAKIYQTFLKITGRKASDVIFVDDDEGNVAAAKKLGFKGIVFKSVPQLKEALRTYGVNA